MTGNTVTSSPSLPRPEHPRPQFTRPDWLSLNGPWEFEIDQADTGLERGLLQRRLERDIIVPFAPESSASGIGTTDLVTACWYRRTFEVPADWADRRIIAHFGAVDHDATVWVNGIEVGRHRGGFTSFDVDITAAVRSTRPGASAEIVVRARDPLHEPQARGKQGRDFAPSGTFYTRTSGIWQSVWLEAVPFRAIEALHTVPVLSRNAFRFSVRTTRNAGGLRVRVVVSDPAGRRWQDEAPAALDMQADLEVQIPEDAVRLWRPGHGELYDVTVSLLDGNDTVDEVTSYAGLRSVAIDGKRVLINGEPVFQRLVLDQGYWPETLMTAPSDEALVRDIEIGLAAGFNGARAHQKVFEERYLYHADRLGYLVWAEFGDWGVNEFGAQGWYQTPTITFVSQWLEAIGRDRNHPSIVGWCPLNEFQERVTDRMSATDDVAQAMFLAARLADGTRPVLDASGFSHRVPDTDIYDSHSYEQDPERFRAEQSGLAEDAPFVNTDDGHTLSTPYAGQPYFVSEFGGIWWSAAEDESWGYGDRPKNVEELYTRFTALVDVLLDDPNMFGYCYTQLSDVEGERNGVVSYDRSVKLDLARLHAAQTRTAAIEK